MRVRTLAGVVVASSLALFGAACTDNDVLTGSGDVVERTIPALAFDRLRVEATFRVHVTLGEPEAVSVRIDDNLVDVLDAGVVDGTLHIGLDPDTSVRDATLEADVVASSLSAIEVTGASSVDVAGSLATDELTLAVAGASALDLLADATTIDLDVAGASALDLLADATTIDLDVAGASAVSLGGSASALAAAVTGTSTVSAETLTAGTLEAELTGASTLTVEVTTSISAEVSGASTLLYEGTPEIVRRDVSGASTIAHV